MVTIAVIGVAAALLALQFKNLKSEYGIYITLAACLIIFFYSVGRLTSILGMIENIVDITTINSEYIMAIIKIVGITYISEFASDICRDCGYSAISNQLHIFGKLTVLALSAPILESLINMVGEIL